MSDETATREGYDRWAASYDAADNPLVAMATLALGHATRHWAGAAVLELGCGTGRNARQILDAGARRYVGIDGSPEMLARARQRLAGDGRARFAVADLAQAPREDFDVALYCLVLEHVEKLDGALTAAASTLRAGGTLHLYELHPAMWHDGARAHFVVDGNEQTLPSWPHDESELARVMPACGLELVHARSWYATEAACAASAKLRKRFGRPVLLEAVARRR
jgi:SAM-dependent methyltransferase